MIFYKETNFKETPVGTIPRDWDVVNFASMVNILKGYAFSSEFFNEKKKGLPLIRIRDLGKNETECYYSGEYDPVYIVRKGDILISMDGEFNVYSWNGPEGLLNQRVCKVSSKEPEKLDNNFLFYALQKPIKIIESQISQTTVKHLLDKDIERIKIPFPPVEEQRVIAGVLGVVDSVIAKTDEVIAKTERLKRGLMQILLTRGIGHKEFKETEIGKIPKEWDVKKVSDLFDVATGTTPSTKQKEYWNGGTINWITPTDLSKLNGTIYIKGSERKITERALKETNLTLMPKGSIIVSTRAPVGYVAVLEEPSTFNQGCKGLIPKRQGEIMPEFYCYYLLSKKQTLENFSGGSTFKELSKEKLLNLSIPLPSLIEQKRIAESILNLDRKIGIERNERVRLERIKRGLMDLLLTGKVRVKVE